MTTTELATNQSLTPLAVLDKAIASGASVESLERLVALQERWQANEAKRAFTAALSSLRSELPHIAKGKTVDFSTSKGRTHYRYEDLADLTEQLSPAMSKHGLSFRWRTDATQPGYIAVTCIVAHADGHEEETTLSGPYDNSGNKNPIQAIGSVVTYLQRYTLKAAIGVAAGVDDDGRGVPPNEPPETPQPGAASHSANASDAAAPKCPACGSGVWDNREKIKSGKFNEKSPLWTCKNKENCTGGANSQPWASWLDDPFTPAEDRPQEAPPEEPQYGPHAQSLIGMLSRLKVPKAEAGRWLSAIVKYEVASPEAVFAQEDVCETVLSVVKGMKDEGWTAERIGNMHELEAGIVF
jgi:hypothetical protein